MLFSVTFYKGPSRPSFGPLDENLDENKKLASFLVPFYLPLST